MDDDALMAEAIAESARARGATGDNPWVGAVIALGGEIVARGHTQPPGRHHAEIAAIEAARARGIALAGATLVSTLEPCSFHGRTPPCVAAIVEQGIARVVIGIRDPHPRVDGEGVRLLRAAGIEVVEGVRAAAIEASLAGWIERHRGDRPDR